MDNAHEVGKRWYGAGEVVLWVIFYFWALWVFDALLPPKPEHTPFGAYIGHRLKGQFSCRAPPQAWNTEGERPVGADGSRSSRE